MITQKQNTEMGIIIALALLILSIIFKWEHTTAFVIIMLLLSILIPVLFTPVSWIWFKFARLLEKIFSSIILIIVFYIVLTPVSLIRSIFTKNDSLLLRKFGKSRQSVFQQRGHTYQSTDLHNQF